MTKEKIKKILHSSNENLNKIIENQNFIGYANLNIPVVGQQTFQDIERMFNFCLKEQYINETYDYDAPNSELLLHFKITKVEFDTFQINIDNVLDSYTDSSLDMGRRRIMLSEQLKKFVGQFDRENMEDTYGINRMNDRLYTDNQSSSTRYLNEVLKELEKAGINQVDDGKYLAIEKLSKEYINIIKLKNEFFKEKVDYLKQLKKDGKKEEFFLKIHEYIVNIYNHSEHLEDVSLFIFYLLYGKGKVHIYLIHSLLGIETKPIRDFYLKLFLKDKKTGTDKNFLRHTICDPRGMSFVINDYDLVKKEKIHKYLDYENLNIEEQELIDTILYVETTVTLEEILTKNILFEKIVNFIEYKDIYQKT